MPPTVPRPSRPTRPSPTSSATAPAPPKASPSDPRYPDQWSLPRIGWDVVRDGPAPAGRAVVAILDTGVDATHPDLAGRLLPGASFVDGVEPGQDPNGHGTWMAGIVAAHTDNGVGVAGVAFARVKVLPITVLGADGRGYDSAIVSGIVAAVDAGADVILMSFSAPGYSAVLQAAIDYAWAHDVVVVAATGNDGSSAAAYPAADRGVIGVTATDRDDRLAPGSNSGPAAFMAAPGVDILTTDAGGDYRSVSGTSASAAEVAGAAGLLRAMDPGAANGVIVGRLARSAAPAGAVDETGNGRLDLARAAADAGTDVIEPAGVAGAADGGPFVGPYVAATLRTWTGLGADANWTTALNWGGTAPVAGDDLVFPAGAARLVEHEQLRRRDGVQLDHDLRDGVHARRQPHRARRGRPDVERRRLGQHREPPAGLRGDGVDDGDGRELDRDAVRDAVRCRRHHEGGGGDAAALGRQHVHRADLGHRGHAQAGHRQRGGRELGPRVSSGATFDLAGFSDTLGSIAGVAGSTITSSAAGAVTLSGGLAGNASTVFAGTLANGSGTVALAKTGTGTLTLSGTNTYSGGTTVTTGVIRVQSNGALGTTAGGTTIASGAAVELDGTGLVIAEPVTSVAGTGILGAGAIRNLANANAWTGAIVLANSTTVGSDAGTLTLSTGGITGATRALTVTGAGNTTIGSVIATTSGSLTKTGAGTLVLSGANTYTGATTVSGGIVKVQSNAALGTTATGTSVATGAELDIDGSGLVDR